MAQVSKFDGLIHAKNGKLYDPTNLHEVSNGLFDISDIMMRDHPMSDSRDDVFFEKAFQKDLAKEAKEEAKRN